MDLLSVTEEWDDALLLVLTWQCIIYEHRIAREVEGGG